MEEANKYLVRFSQLLDLAKVGIFNLFPTIRRMSIDELQHKNLRLPLEQISQCLRAYEYLKLYNITEELSELGASNHFSDTLKLRLTEFVREEQSQVHRNFLQGLVERTTKLDSELIKCAYYTQDIKNDVFSYLLFINEPEIHDKNSIERKAELSTNVIGWIEDMRDWLADLIPILENSQPQSLRDAPDTSAQPNRSKKPPARDFVNFTEKLRDGFKEKDLNDLLVCVNFKNSEGATLQFKKYLMHQVIDALIEEEYFEKGAREKDQKALSRYLGLKESRVQVEHGSPKESVKKKAVAFLSELKKQRKING